MRALSTLLCFMVVLLSSCSGVKPAPVEDSLRSTWIDRSDPVFANGARLLDGIHIDPNRAEFEGQPTWRVGDAVLLGIRIEAPERTTVRFLLVQAVGKTGRMLIDEYKTSDAKGNKRGVPIVSYLIASRLELYDQDGVRLSAADGEISEVHLSVGAYDMLEISLKHGDGEEGSMSALDGESYRRQVIGAASLIAFSTASNRNNVFSKLLKDVIDRPNLISAVFNREISLGYATKGLAREADFSTGDSQSLETIGGDLELRAFGTSALQGRMVMAPIHAPLGLCGGLVRARAFRPSDPRHRVDIVLLACARGPER